MMNRAKNKVRIYILAILLFSIYAFRSDAQNSFVKNSFSFVVGSTIKKTDLKIKEGDELHISASGTVVVQGFTGSVGPEGIDGYKNHRMDPVFPYGALLYKVGDDDWNIVDPEDTITAERAGLLKFMVNDNDPSTNTGKFTVKVLVKSLKPETAQKIAKNAQPKKAPEITPPHAVASSHTSGGTLTLSELQKASSNNAEGVKSFLTSKQFQFDDASKDDMSKYNYKKDDVSASIIKDTKANQTTFITSSDDNYRSIKASLDKFGYRLRKSEKKVDGVNKYANSKYSLSIVQVSLNNKPQYFITIKKLESK